MDDGTSDLILAWSARPPVLSTGNPVMRVHRCTDLDATAVWGDPGGALQMGGRVFTREEVWHRSLR